MIERARSRWLVSAVLGGLGAVVLVAAAADDDLAGGLAWFAILVVAAATHALAPRGGPAEDALGDAGDERDRAIGLRAMAAAGTVLVVLLTAAILVETVRGDDPTPYIWPLAVGGAVYGMALVVLRRRS